MKRDDSKEEKIVVYNPDGDDHFRAIINYLKQHYQPADVTNADLELTTEDLFDIMQKHYPAAYEPITIYNAMVQAGFHYGNSLSNGIRFVWFLKNTHP